MFQSEETIHKNIIAPGGDTEFQIRFKHNDQVGVLTGRSGKSWFILDSKDYWYDLIQENYPNRRKCNCKNDFFRIGSGIPSLQQESLTQQIKIP